MLAAVNAFFVNRRTELWEHTLATFAAVISRLSVLLITLINTQLLSPKEFGLFAVLSLIANIVIAFVSCGGDMWLNRFCRARHVHFAKAPIVARFYLQISVFLAACVVFCALGFATFAKDIFAGQGLTIAFCLLWSAAAGLIETVLAILRTTNKISRFFVVRDIFMPLVLILAIFILKIDTAFEFFLVAFMLWMGTLLFLLNHILSHFDLYMPRSHWTWQLLRKELIGYTTNLVFNNFTSRVANGLDTLLLTQILPLHIVGRYRLLSHFSNAFSVVQHFVFLTLPWHFRQQKNGTLILNPEKTILFRQRLLLFSAIPALLVFIIAAKPVLSQLGSEYQTMTNVFCFLLLIRFSEMAWGPQHEKLISNNEVFEDTKANLLAIMTGLILFFITYRQLGPLKSAIVCIGVGSFVGQLRRSYAIHKKLNLPNRYKLPWAPFVINAATIYWICLIV